MTSVWAAVAAAGKAIYDKSCKTCHGPDGTPPAGVAKAMGIRDFKTTDFSEADVKTAVTSQVSIFISWLYILAKSNTAHFNGHTGATIPLCIDF